jgi:hypothetical protein
MFRIIVDDPAHQEAVAKGGEPLQVLCRKEVDDFDRHLRQLGGEFADGLAKFERRAIEGYLYQKLRGHIGPKNKNGDNVQERKDGET